MIASKQPQPQGVWLTKKEKIAGFIYLPAHLVLLPILLGYAELYSPVPLSEMAINCIYYAIGFVFVMTLLRGVLRRSFDTLIDHPFAGLGSMLSGYCVEIIATYAIAVIMLVVPLSLGDSNPNTDAVMNVTGRDYQVMKALAIFIAPVVEEVLFRGVLFGSIRGKNRIAAYLVSALVFGLYHLWQYALAAGDWTIFVYIVQYIPASFALAWCYERSGSLWPAIFYHMLVNYLSYAFVG